LDEIEQLNRSAGKDILSIGRKGLSAHAQVGIIRVRNLDFEILPKIDHSDKKQKKAAHAAACNLLWMLSIAGDINIQEHKIGQMSETPGSWFELLTHLFAAGLHREALSGFSHQYISQRSIQPVLRGRWEIHRQFTRQPYPQPNFDVVVDEFTADIPLNRIFRWVVERLFELTSDSENKLLLAELRERFGQVTLPDRLPSDLISQIHFSRLDDRFQPAFNLANLFLSANVVHLAGGNQASYAFTFDMNILFERFVAGFLKLRRTQLLPEQWNNVAIYSQAEIQPVYLGSTSGRPFLRMRPDLLFKQPGHTRPVLIADTKYKTLRPTSRGFNFSEEDIYQILAYSTRFECPHLLLIYPQSAESGKVRQVIQLDSVQTNLFACTINLHQPRSDSEGLLDELCGILYQAAGLTDSRPDPFGFLRG